MQELRSRGMDDVSFYDPVDTSVGGIHAFFITRGDPRTYNLPPKPEIPTIYNQRGWRASAIAGGLLLASALLAFLGDRR